MRVVVIGATGNVGTSVLDALATETAVAGDRRGRAPPARPLCPLTRFESADITSSDLVPILRGAGRRRAPGMADPARA